MSELKRMRIREEHYETSEIAYVADDGFYMGRLISGCTPNGNKLNGKWVLISPESEIVDFDKYRHDLAERNGYRLE